MNLTNLLRELLEISIQLGDHQSDLQSLEQQANQQSILLQELMKDMENLTRGR